MSATAKVYNMAEHRDRHQVENGHIRIADGVMDDILQAPLTLRQLKVVLAVIRKTYGFHKKTDRLPASQIAEMTGLSKGRVLDTLSQLIAMNVLYRVGGQRGELGYNKRIESWNLDAKPAKKAPKSSIPESGTLGSEYPRNGVTEYPRFGTLIKTYRHKAKTDDPNGSSLANGVAVTPKKSRSRSRKKPDASKAPTCPHQKLVELWEEQFPEKPVVYALDDTAKSRIQKGWAYAWKTDHSKSGRPMYVHHHPDDVDPAWPRGTQEQGVDWWGRFFWYLANHCSDMAAEGWFTFDMFVRPDKIRKAMMKTYENKQGDA